MIISASRRTDIPAFHAKWFINRLEEGYSIISNPYDSNSVSKVVINPDIVDCIAFRTKNPEPMFPLLDRMSEYNYFFQVTINPYGKEMESRVPKLVDRISSFQKLSDLIGSEKMVWRYDPVMISTIYDFDFHSRAFEYLTEKLSGYCHRCMIGFIEMHPFVENRIGRYGVLHKSTPDILKIADIFSGIGKKHNMVIETCAEQTELHEFGIDHGACIDRTHVEQIIGYKFGKVKEKYLRPHCKCMESIDIGHYSTCMNGCDYCYATIQAPQVNPDINNPSLDPLLNREKIKNLNITELDCRSLKNPQLGLW